MDVTSNQSSHSPLEPPATCFYFAQSSQQRRTMPPTQHRQILKMDQLALWHARIAHTPVSKLPHVGRVAILPESFINATSDTYLAPGICEPCLQGKQTRHPHPSVPYRHVDPLELIHTDTCNLPVPSIKGNKDVLSLTDQATRMSFIYFLLGKRPSTILKIFEEFKDRVEPHWHSRGGIQDQGRSNGLWQRVLSCSPKFKSLSGDASELPGAKRH